MKWVGGSNKMLYQIKENKRTLLKAMKQCYDFQKSLSSIY